MAQSINLSTKNNPNLLSDSDKMKAKKSSDSDGLNPHNMIWAVKHHYKKPDELVILQFDDAMMRVMGLKSKNKEEGSAK